LEGSFTGEKRKGRPKARISQIKNHHMKRLKEKFFINTSPFYHFRHSLNNVLIIGGYDKNVRKMIGQPEIDRTTG
jgi:hypothetical protein